VAEQIATQMASLLNNETVTNALNAPSVSGEAMAAIAPYLDLGSRAGRLAAQVHTGDVERIEIRYHGALTDLDVRPITAGVLTEILVAKVDGHANPVSATSIARARGITVESTQAGEHPDFTNLLEIKVIGPSTTEVRAALFGKSSPRIVGIDSYSLELVPAGMMLLIQTEDRPGVIGAIGTELGSRQINVSGLVLGIRDAGGRALAFWSTEQDVDQASLASVRAVDGVIGVQALRLG
jgi:D-3-phosphoglycerate dehydrogenase